MIDEHTALLERLAGEVKCSEKNQLQWHYFFITNAIWNIMGLNFGL
jgi:hypothetical protein